MTELAIGIDAVDAFDPEYVVVSLGVDPADGDPTAGLCLTTADFADVGKALAHDRPATADRAGGRLPIAPSRRRRACRTGWRVQA